MNIIKEVKKDRRYARYYDYTHKDNNAIKVEVSYDLGGWNYFTGQKEGRGIYVSVTPVSISEHTERFQAFSGYKMLVKESNRYSDRLLESNKGYLDIDDTTTRELFMSVLNK